MAELCPICGKPHGKGLPNNDVERRAAPVALNISDEVMVPVPEVDLAYQPEAPSPLATAEPEIASEMTEYDSMKINELRGQLRLHGLEQKFGEKKAEMIARLKEADEA